MRVRIPSYSYTTSLTLTGGEVVPLEFLPASIPKSDMGVDECVLRVRWSEPVISCAGLCLSMCCL